MSPANPNPRHSPRGSARTPTPIPEHINRYLFTASKYETNDLLAYLEHGATLVDEGAIAALRDLLPALKEKMRGIHDSDRLRQRLEVLVRYFEETLGDVYHSPAARSSVAFALLYFFKGYDRIPDSIPEIGLLDDALVADAALQRNSAALRAHWQRLGRVWPENL